MTRFLRFGWVLAALLAGCATPSETTTDAPPASPRTELAPTTPTDLHALFRWQPGRRTLISAHRGGPAPGYPENALATFERTLTVTPALIECDPQMTRDSVLVLMHDDDLDRTTDGRGPVGARTLAELRTLRLRDNDGVLTEYRIPTLAETLTWARGKAILTIDKKRSVPVEAIARLIAEQDATAYATVITYNLRDAERYHALNSNLIVSVPVRNLEELERLAAADIPLDRVVAFTGTRNPNAALFQALHERGVMAIFGTLGNLDRRAAARGDNLYGEIAEQGADILATDRPDAVAAALYATSEE